MSLSLYGYVYMSGCVYCRVLLSDGTSMRRLVGYIAIR